MAWAEASLDSGPVALTWSIRLRLASKSTMGAGSCQRIFLLPPPGRPAPGASQRQGRSAHTQRVPYVSPCRNAALESGRSALGVCRAESSRTLGGSSRPSPSPLPPCTEASVFLTRRPCGRTVTGARRVPGSLGTRATRAICCCVGAGGRLLCHGEGAVWKRPARRSTFVLSSSGAESAARCSAHLATRARRIRAGAFGQRQTRVESGETSPRSPLRGRAVLDAAGSATSRSC